MHTTYLTHTLCQKHDMGHYHPECPARIQVIQDELIATGLYDCLLAIDAPAATREQLLRAHHADYINEVIQRSPSQGLIQLDGDTAMNQYSYQAALHAAGAGVKAVDLIMQQQAINAFCNVRPPGHHAEAARAMGFCIFNNIAVAAAHALQQHGLQRVAIVDFDVHHGNGTEDIFRYDARVLFCSTFQHPFYPYSGKDSGNQHIINTPLKAHSTPDEFRHAVEQHWLPALHQHRPEMIFISAGFDAHRADDMGQLNLSEADYTWVTQQIKQIAELYAHGRIVSMLEGGYELDALARSVAAHVRVLLS